MQLLGSGAAGLVCLMLVPAVARSQTTCVQPPADLVSWWAADGNADDIQGSNGGTLENGATFAAGKTGLGQAFSLDGTDDFVLVPDADSLDITGEITLGAWVNVTALGIHHMVVTKQPSPGSSSNLAGNYEFRINPKTLNPM